MDECMDGWMGGWTADGYISGYVGLQDTLQKSDEFLSSLCGVFFIEGKKYIGKMVWIQEEPWGKEAL